MWMGKVSSMPVVLMAVVACDVEPERIESEAGTCPATEVVEAAADLAHEELDLGELYLATLVAESFQDRASFASWLGEQGITSVPEVDFATEQVVVAVVTIGGTCTGGQAEWRVVDLDGAAHLDLSVHDGSSACDEVCDMAASHVVAVTVPAGTAATACARLTETCEQASRDRHLRRVARAGRDSGASGR